VLNTVGKEMTLEDLGYNVELGNYRKDQNLDSFGVGRIISEHKERYIVKTTEKEYDGEIIRNLRFSAVKRADFPAVGDWVAISPVNCVTTIASNGHSFTQSMQPIHLPSIDSG